MLRAKEANREEGNRGDFRGAESKKVSGLGAKGKTLPKQPVGSFSDTSGNPSDHTNLALLATLKREWQHQLAANKVIKGVAIYFNPSEPSLDEIIENELRVRRMLYE